MKKKVSLLVALLLLTLSSTACVFETQADKVSHNVSEQADTFNVLRRFVKINTRTDEILFEVIGAFSLQDEGSKVYILVEDENKNYYKHIIDVSGSEVTWNVEDLGGAKVNKYRYEVNYQPESIIPIEIVTDKD